MKPVIEVSTQRRISPAFCNNTGATQKHMKRPFSQTLFNPLTPNLFGRMVCLHELSWKQLTSALLKCGQKMELRPIFAGTV
jgi:hypothetical protein